MKENLKHPNKWKDTVDMDGRLTPQSDLWSSAIPIKIPTASFTDMEKGPSDTHGTARDPK